MRKIILLGIFLLTVGFLAAQQEPQTTQFMYNKLVYNPGYAGTKEVPCLTAIYRAQWLGLEGAPTTQVLTFNMPLSNQRIGLGATVARHNIGIFENITVDGVYAYRLRLGKGYIGLGLQTSLRSISANFADERLLATQPMDIDGSIPAGMQQKFLFNFGAGAYYQGENFFLGVSAPRLIENNIDFADSDVVLSREFQHLYMMGGASISLNENLDLQPQLLIKYVNNAPLDADINLSLNISRKFIVGGTYRLGGSTEVGLGESIDILLAGQISNQLLLGVSYDITLSDLRDYNTGSVEVALRYCFGQAEGEEYVNPRFF